MIKVYCLQPLCCGLLASIPDLGWRPLTLSLTHTHTLTQTHTQQLDDLAFGQYTNNLQVLLQGLIQLQTVRRLNMLSWSFEGKTELNMCGIHLVKELNSKSHHPTRRHTHMHTRAHAHTPTGWATICSSRAARGGEPLQAAKLSAASAPVLALATSQPSVRTKVAGSGTGLGCCRQNEDTVQ